MSLIGNALQAFKHRRELKLASRAVDAFRKGKQMATLPDKPAIRSKTVWGLLLLVVPQILRVLAGETSLGETVKNPDTIKAVLDLASLAGAAVGGLGLRQAVGRANSGAPDS